ASALTGAVTAGGAATLLTGGLGGIAGVAAGAITGAKQSYGKADYRSLTFHIGGTVDNPKMSNFKVGGKNFDAKAAAAENNKLLNATNVKEKVEDVKAKAKEKVQNEVNKAVDKLLGGKSDAKSKGKTDGKQSTKDKVRDQINQELTKGLGKLFGGGKKK
ncbi:MAG: hypothetical protein IJ233_13140, partial [Pyramidobacter sp.]|nr:hypothetical protein [Pyramidobacter sp.]